MTDSASLPTRVVRDYLSDSRVWGDFVAQGGFREGDIVVADPFKAGTTWTQRIIQQVRILGSAQRHRAVAALGSMRSGLVRSRP
jgi:hypothetical protein